MASSLVYTRKFFILKKEFATTEKRNQKGHGKVEFKGIRGNLLVSVENAEADQVYNVAFIAEDDLNPIYNLGKIFTDNLGKGKGQYSFIFKELETKNFPVDKITGILIMADKEIFLGGYLDNDQGSIQQYMESLATRDERIYLEEEVELEESYDSIELDEEDQALEPAYIEQEEVEVLEPDCIEQEVEEVLDLDSIQYEEEETIEPDPIEIEIPKEPPKIETSEEVEEIEELFAPEDTESLDLERIEEDYKTWEYFRKLNQKDQTVDYVLSILRFFPYIEPFKQALHGYNWWIVEMDKENEYSSFLPYFSHVTGGNNKEPYNKLGITCNELIDKYNHYLFGLYNEGGSVRYFLYGIPGEFTLNEQPYKGEGGFSTWYEGENTFGYWIVYIDPMTGKPIELINPMVPIE